MAQKRIVKKRIKVQGFLIFCGSFLILLLSRFIFPRWRGEFWDEIFDVTGILMVLFGYLWRISARGEKHERSLEGKALVMSGPYAMIQHPMYTGSFLIGLGIIVMLFNPWVVLVLVAVFLGIYIPQLRKEEANLKARFGTDYEAYARQTPRLFPKLEKVLNLREYIPFKWSWLKNEWRSFAFVIGLILVIELWQDYKYFGPEELIKEPVEMLAICVAFFLIAFYFRRTS